MKEITNKAEFDSIIKNGKVLVKIGTSSCHPCKLVHNNISNIENDYSAVTFIEIDADSCDEDLIDFFNVRNVPDIRLYENGKETAHKVGLQTEENIRELLN